MKEAAFQKCIDPDCARTFSVDETLYACPDCGSLIDVCYDWDRARPPRRLRDFEEKYARRRDRLAFSGVWRFKELLDFCPEECVLTIGEGQTLLRASPRVARYVGLSDDGLFLQYEGLNPSGSFKDNGMTAAFSHARMVGARVGACASTGNTSASLAAFASATGALEAVILVGSGKIAAGKLSQALDFGALTIQIDGYFDDAMKRIVEASRELKLYLMNSVNPFRLEGQKAIMYRVLEGLGWEPPDWIICPGGNLGNSSAFGKAFAELRELGLIDSVPRLAIINASGAPTLFELAEERGVRWNGGRYDKEAVRAYYERLDREKLDAHTIASAIEINRPVNLSKALRAIELTEGLVRTVTDEEILDAKALVGRGGIGCEPASAASVAGCRKLVREGEIEKGGRVVCILTGHQLKDPAATIGYHSPGSSEREKLGGYGIAEARFSNEPVQVPNDIRAIVRAIEGRS